ncbi:hypothetical protein SETIT_1G286300v2 [Setaria italica]|uniref:Uncharacterized protein n=1 Tax=Setaria italica TaxID=4555 RepID=A0A368PSJ7_SETIT|nr:hypothetical protein SETIT_1G286300v2 [Setaria italica]
MTARRAAGRDGVVARSQTLPCQAPAPPHAERRLTSAPAPDIQPTTVQRVEETQILPITSSAVSSSDPYAQPSANETFPQMPTSGSSAIAQDSPSDSLFSFNVDDFMAEDEVGPSSTSTQQTIVTPLADENIIELVQDAELICTILQSVRNHLTPELESAIIPAAFIEGHQFQVFQAQQRLADRSAQQEELEDVRVAINDQEQKLNQLPETVGKIREEVVLKIHQARTLHQSIKPIPETVEDDNRIIDEIDQIRLRAVNAIQKTLGSL